MSVFSGLPAAHGRNGCYATERGDARRYTSNSHSVARHSSRVSRSDCEHLAMNLVYLVMLHVNATSRSVPGLTTDHDVAHCAYFSAFRAGSRNLLRKEPKARLIPGARPSGAGFALGSESQVRCSLAGGGRRFRTIGPAVKETAVQGGPRPTIVPSLDNLCAAGLICTSRRKALGPHARSSIPCGDNRASILGPSAPPSATIKAEIPTFQMRIITLASIS